MEIARQQQNSLLEEFKNLTKKQKVYSEIKFIMKNEDTEWIELNRDGQDVLYNSETEEYVWKNPYYAWRLEEKYEAIPLTITEWINDAISPNNLRKIIELSTQRLVEIS